jgi:hypothetical protein
MHVGDARNRVRRWLAEHAEPLTFWALVAVHLIPIWACRYLPTQDGPAHLNNAQILKDYGSPRPGYAEFFELRVEPLPNLTSHLLLALLLTVIPPLVAEKVLVSVYVIGFAGSFRYFLGAFGPRCRPLSWAGLLFVFNRCFWMGFYNYCLSLVLLWVILGYCLRQRPTASWRPLGVLMLLFTALHFTHLMGFLIALAGAVGSALLGPKPRWRMLAIVGLAGLPGLGLTMHYLEQTHFLREPSTGQLVQYPRARLRGEWLDKRVVDEVTGLDRELFEHHAGRELSFTLFVVLYFQLVAGLAWATHTPAAHPPPDAQAGRLFPLVFGSLLFALYVLVPDQLGLDHGGFLKCRLAFLPPLIWLACLREPAPFGARLLVRSVTVVLLGVNLALVTRTVYAGNQELEPYVAGIEAVGSGRRLFVAQAVSASPQLVQPLLHASHYYCVGRGNLNLDNYEASRPHFPVKYRPGVSRGRGHWAGYANLDAVDIVLCWQTAPPDGHAGPPGWEAIFSRGPMRIYRRPR